MMGDQIDTLPRASAEFAPDARTIREARAFVVGAADIPDDVSFVVELLVSELAANAVLHAATSYAVSVYCLPDRIRVEVSDGDPTLPVPKPHSLDAPTGRGLRILESLSLRWGATPVDGGKVVWFEAAVPEPVPDASSNAEGSPEVGSSDPLSAAVTTGLSAEQPAVDAGANGTRPAGDVTIFDVRFLGLPVDIQAAASQHYDGLRREFAVMRESESAGSVPYRLQELIDELEDRLGGIGDGPREAIAAARERGETSVDVVYQVPPHAADAAIRLDRMLDEVDDYCRTGRHLLSLTTPPELLRFRRWFLEEMVSQIGGAAPRPWSEAQVHRSPGTPDHDGADDATGHTAGGVAGAATPLQLPPEARLDIDDGHPVLRLAGELDLRSSGPIRDALTVLQATYDGDATLDLSDVTFVDSVGISVLAATHARYDRDHRTIHMVIPETLRPVFEITGLDQVFALRPSI